MKQTSLPEVIYLDVDNLTTENNSAAWDNFDIVEQELK